MPTYVLDSFPGMMNVTCGMPSTPNAAAVLGLLSTSTDINSTLPANFSAAASKAGLNWRQGPHQVALKSTIIRWFVFIPGRSILSLSSSMTPIFTWSGLSISASSATVCAASICSSMFWVAVSVVSCPFPFFDDWEQDVAIVRANTAAMADANVFLIVWYIVDMILRTRNHGLLFEPVVVCSL